MTDRTALIKELKGYVAPVHVDRLMTEAAAAILEDQQEILKSTGKHAAAEGFLVGMLQELKRRMDDEGMDLCDEGLKRARDHYGVKL